MKREAVMRIQMVQGLPQDKQGGGTRTFESGRFYLLPESEARDLIAKGAAIDPDNPPAPAEATTAPEVAPAESGGDA